MTDVDLTFVHGTVCSLPEPQSMRRKLAGATDAFIQGPAGGVKGRQQVFLFRAPASLPVLRKGWLGELAVALLPLGRGQGGAQATPYLGAQSIPCPCAQLIGLGLCHVRPFLCVIQLMLRLAVLGQICAGLLLLGTQAGWVALCSHPIPRRGLASPGPQLCSHKYPKQEGEG